MSSSYEILPNARDAIIYSNGLHFETSGEMCEYVNDANARRLTRPGQSRRVLKKNRDKTYKKRLKVLFKICRILYVYLSKI